MATKKSELVLTCNATAIKDVMNFLNQKLDELIRKRDQLNAKGVQNWTAQDKKNFKQWGDDIAAINSAMQKNRDEMVKYAQVMKDLAGSKTKDLKRALGEVKRALDNMSAKDPRREQLVSDLRKIQAQIDANTGSIKKQQSAWGSLGTTLKNLVAYAGVFAMFNKIKGLFTDIIKLNSELSDQLANIRKVSGLAMQDINKLSVNLSKIDTRSSIQELNELAYTGSKLGFGEYGTAGLESFVKSALKVQNALKEDMGADAMTSLSKMVEVMGLIPKMGVEKAMDATGSAIFKLASTSTATGSNIVEFSKRLMGLANIAGISTDELLAFGSAADSMALMPEVAATAFNKLITAMQKQPNLIENALHIEQGTISDMYQAGRMADAMVLVFEKMREKGGMNALMHAGVFKDLGSDGARLVSVMATMANRVDILNKHMATSRQAFAEATAVEQEYNIQMQTAAAFTERANNMWEKAFVNPQGVDMVKELSKAWYDVSKSLTTNEKSMYGLRMAIEGIIYVLKTLLKLLPEIAATFGVSTMWFWITKLREGEGLLASLTAWFGKLTAAQKAFFKAAGWVGLALTIYEVGKAVYDLANKTKEAGQFMKGFKDDLSDLNKEFGVGQTELDRYKRAIDNATVGTKQRAAAINNFNTKFKQYLSNMLTEKSTAIDVAKAYNEITKAMRAKMALQLKEKDIEKHVTPRVGWAVQRREEYNQLVSGTNKSQYNGDWLYGYMQDNKGKKNLQQIARDLNNSIFHVTETSFNSVMSQLNSGEFNELVTKTVKMGSGKKTVQELMGPAAKQLWAALRYAAQDMAADFANERINTKYAPEQKAMDDYLAQQEQPTTPEPLTPAPDKDAEKALTKAQQEAKKAMRKEMEDAQKDSTAVINAIEEFYRLQESAAEQMVADGKLTRSEADKMIEYLRNRKDEMLLEARRAITGNKNNFEELRQTMGKDVLRPGDEATDRAKETVQTVDVNKAAANLKKYDGSNNVYGLNSGSFTQSVLKNAAQNELNITRRQAKVAEETEKILMQFHFVEQAQKSFGDQLVKLGLVTEGYEKVVRQLSDGTEVTANTKDVQALANKVVSTDSRLYNVDTGDAMELSNMTRYIMTDQATGMKEDFASMFPKLDEWLEDPENHLREMQALYKTLLNYDTEYYNSIKQSYDQQKKQFETRWETSGKGQLYSDVGKDINMEGRRQKMTGEDQGTNFAQVAGFANIGNDPEVQLSMLRMAQMQEELEMFKQVNAQKKLEGEELLAFNQGLHEKQQAIDEAEMAMQESLMQHINDHISKLEQWTQPIEQFATEVGDAMGKAVFEGESMAEGMQNALKSLVKSWGESTISIVKDLMMQQLKQKLIGKAMVKEEKKNQGEMTDTDEESGKERLSLTSTIEQGISGITQTMGQQVLATKQTQDTQEMTQEGTKAQGTVMAGIAEMAAKVLGTLGPFGAPLIAVFTALLMGLLSAALSALGGGGGNSGNESAAKTKVKLKSGMLTYDEGNVQTVVGDDGHVYRAREQASLPQGVSMITQPIATRVNGQQALVGERGPEIVIGRKTTRAIQMNRPDLLRDLVMFDRGMTTRKARTFDEGNLNELASAIRPSDGEQQPSQQQSQTDASAERQALIDRMDKSDALMAQVLHYLQNPVAPNINMYGENGLHSKIKKADQFMKKYSD